MNTDCDREPESFLPLMDKLMHLNCRHPDRMQLPQTQERRALQAAF